MNRKLGKKALEDIRDSIKHAVNTKQEAVRLAGVYGVNWQRIYEVTEDIRPKQKTRSDKGKTKWELTPDTDLWQVFELVSHSNQPPDLALETVQMRIREDENREANLPRIGVLRRLLNKKGLSRMDKKNKKGAFRRWESKFPGEIIQFDNSGLKVGYFTDDVSKRTRAVLRILGDDEIDNKNHPTAKKLIRVWQQCAVDDCSRQTLLRYKVKEKLTSRDQLEFELLVFEKFGLPLKTYTDNGGEMRGDVAEVDKLLDVITKNAGGFEHLKHKAHNAKATGKTEIRHQYAQKMERLIALAIEEGHQITPELLEAFGERISKNYNEVHINRTTGQTPMERWWSRKIVSRQIPYEVLASALLSDIFEAKMNGDVTVTHKSKTYQLPRVQPFVDYVSSKEKLKIVVPENIDVLLVRLPCDASDQWREVTKVIAVADEAGEYKQVAESESQQLQKQLKATRIERIKKTKEAENKPAIPYVTREVEVIQSEKLLSFPQKTPEITIADVERVLPIATSLTSEPEFAYWDAVNEFTNEFATKGECKQFLSTIFADKLQRLPISVIRTELDNRRRRTILKAV